METRQSEANKKTNDMKEHVQKTGVRRYAGDDFIELQAEPLKVIQSFFEKCGNCVINGCEVIPAGNKYNVTGGIVSISGTDADGVQAAKVVPFAGVENVTLPIYLTLTFAVSERVYGDGKVKPIAYNYTAVAAGVQPAEGIEFLEITSAGGKQFVDAIKVTEKLDKIGNGKDVSVTFAEAAERANVSSGEKLSTLFGKVRKWFAGLATVAFTGKAADLTQDASNRLVTDTEKTSWADKYTRTEVDNKDATVLQSAKEYASDVVNTLSGDVYRKAQTDSKDAATLQAAKEYAAAKVAEIVNSSPGTLDTLSELAAALGNDPNFATSIMALIGGKADRAHGHAISEVTNLQSELNGKAKKNGDNTESFTADAFIANKREVSFNRPRHSGIEMLSANTVGVDGSPGQYYSALSALSGYVGFQLATYGGGTEDLRFRKQSDASIWTPWRDIWHEGNFNPDDFLKKNRNYYTPFGVGYVSNQSSATGIKIRLPHNVYSDTMLCFTVRAYIGYKAYDIQFSGYLYAAIASWYMPNATGICVRDKITVKMGVDADNVPYVWIEGGPWAGVSAINIVSSHNTSDWNSGWEIIRTDDCPNICWEATLYKNIDSYTFLNQLDLKANTNHNHDDAYAPKTHSHSYEPAFNKNDAFNKNFGATAETVAKGNHTHAGMMRFYVKARAVGDASRVNVSSISGPSLISKPHVRHDKGYYKIIHDAGTSNYVVILNGNLTNDNYTHPVKISLISYDSNSFTVKCSDDESENDAIFEFTILLY